MAGRAHDSGRGYEGSGRLDGWSLRETVRSQLTPARARRWLALAGAGVAVTALAVAGLAGAGRYAVTFWLYRGFPAPHVPRSVTVAGPAGPRRVPVRLPTLQTIVVRGAAIGGWPDPVYVVLPPGYASHPSQRYPVLYLLHGFPGEPQGFLDIGQVATTEATLVAEGRMKPLILVMPTGTRSFLADEEWANGIRKGNQWETFVADDLVKAIDSRYRVIPSGQGRGLAGLSEGGYGAINIGLHHPGEFGLLESWSGYFRADHIPAIFGRSKRRLAYNSPATWVHSVAAQLRADHVYIWFYCGTRDPLAPQNREFAAELSALGVAHHFFESPGGHDWRLWRKQMPRALITASEHLSHG
jgi:enterochelin esterase-like enzyme